LIRILKNIQITRNVVIPICIMALYAVCAPEMKYSRTASMSCEEGLERKMLRILLRSDLKL
jgi:hypothetical protein